MMATLKSKIRIIFTLILIFTVFAPLLTGCDASFSGQEVVYSYFGLLFDSILQGDLGGVLYALFFTPFIVGILAIIVHAIRHLITFVSTSKPYTIKYLKIALLSYSLGFLTSVVFGIHLLWGYWATLISLVCSIIFEWILARTPKIMDTS